MAAASGSSIGFRKRKRGVLVKCQGDSVVEYKKSFCVCIATRNEISQPTEWYVLNISSTKDEDKAKKEMKRKHLLRNIPIPELRGAYLAFHHDERHPQSGKKPLPILPLITQLNKAPKPPSSRYHGACSAVIGSTIYRFGGSRLNRRWSRKVIYFDSSRPEEGWKRGPDTLCGRVSAATVTLHGKLYVFGGHNPDIHGFFAEFLDTTSLVEEEGKALGEWSTLPQPPCALGFKGLFAVVLDDVGPYAGKILVGSKLTGAIFLYGDTDKLWTSLGSVNFHGRYFSPPIVVDATIYWISFLQKKLYAYDFLRETELSMRIGDFEICSDMNDPRFTSTYINPILLHLTGDIFCVVWRGSDACLHCTKLQVSSVGVIDAAVLCCHSYKFDHEVGLIDCLSLNASLL
ncbi:hypothetical protein Vadar_020251 [Vaccinium darrowii]|uniref:Uncharacterized protein n=1 Tax=Vaccinium darrowii TaxID=229202 RepID=A0ACB7Y7T8_9ERIC|nr:hypothetical protein Vadar_020251 [Vaccinium darrowii]